MTATSQAISPKRAQDALLLPWYLRDLYKYLLTFAGMTVIYVGFRIYQGAFGISAGLDSTEPAFATHWMRLLYIEAIFSPSCSRRFGDICGSPAITISTLSRRKRKSRVISP